MQVFVSGRQTGKTTALIDWLLDGHEVDMYPYWSRVIVCVSQNAVLHTQKMLYDRTHHLLKGDDTIDWPIHQMRKCVWHRRDLMGGINRGRPRALKHQFEVAVDDLDLFMMEMFGQPVDLATMTGELYDPSVRRPSEATDPAAGGTTEGRDRVGGSRPEHRDSDVPSKSRDPRDELRLRNAEPRKRRPPRIT